MDDEGELRPIGRISAALLRVYGPADTPDNPLTGTRYDPVLRARRDMQLARRHREGLHATRERWDRILHGHNPVPPW